MYMYLLLLPRCACRVGSCGEKEYGLMRYIAFVLPLIAPLARLQTALGYGARP